MIKTISASDLRTQLKEVLNQIVYGDVDYLVEKFGEPTVAIISVTDFRILQEARRQHTTTALRDVLAQVRARHTDLDESEIGALIDDARTDFHRAQGSAANAN